MCDASLAGAAVACRITVDQPRHRRPLRSGAGQRCRQLASARGAPVQIQTVTPDGRGMEVRTGSGRHAVVPDSRRRMTPGTSRHFDVTLPFRRMTSSRTAPGLVRPRCRRRHRLSDRPGLRQGRRPRHPCRKDRRRNARPASPARSRSPSPTTGRPAFSGRPDRRCDRVEGLGRLAALRSPRSIRPSAARRSRRPAVPALPPDARRRGKPGAQVTVVIPDDGRLANCRATSRPELRRRDRPGGHPETRRCTEAGRHAWHRPRPLRRRFRVPSLHHREKAHRAVFGRLRHGRSGTLRLPGGHAARRQWLLYTAPAGARMHAVARHDPNGGRKMHLSAGTEPEERRRKIESRRSGSASCCPVDPHRERGLHLPGAQESARRCRHVERRRSGSAAAARPDPHRNGRCICPRGTKLVGGK